MLAKEANLLRIGLVPPGIAQKLVDIRGRHSQAVAYVVIIFDDGQEQLVVRAAGLEPDRGFQISLDFTDCRQFQHTRTSTFNLCESDGVEEIGLACRLAKSAAQMGHGQAIEPLVQVAQPESEMILGQLRKVADFLLIGRRSCSFVFSSRVSSSLRVYWTPPSMR
jgi:protein required for attachment to host cells